MIDIRIREIVEADLAGILRINQANVPEVGPLDLTALRFLVDECRFPLIVERLEVDRASDFDIPMGFCLVFGPGSTYESVNYSWFMEHYPDAMYLDRVAFDAGFQRAGHGRMLYEHVEQRISDEMPDASGLGLEVNIDPPNEPSLRFHDTLGYAEVGRQMSHGIEVSLMFKQSAGFGAP